MNSDQSIVPELLTLKQAAELCNVSETTLKNWAKSGKAPPLIKLGPSKQSSSRFSRTAYMAWISGGCKPVSEQQEGAR